MPTMRPWHCAASAHALPGSTASRFPPDAATGSSTGRKRRAPARRARKVDAGNRFGRSSPGQRFITRQLVEASRTNAIVVRLKGGDPMVFGRAQEELDALADAGIDCEVVPGVTAALAAA